MSFARLMLIALAAAAVALQAPSPAEASVGFRRLTVPNPEGGQMEAGVWYPADQPATTTLDLGLMRQTLAVGAPMVGERLPMVVISHGNGGSLAGHADTAAALAEAGFIAVALTHPGDNYADQSHSTDLPARPRQLSALIDYMLGAWPEHGRIDPRRIGAFGFSAGGFTVMAASGAMGDYALVKDHCARLPEAFECRLLAATPPTGGTWKRWTPDSRIRAVAAAAPAFGYAFSDESLAGIRIPVQLWRAADDQILASPHHVEPIHRRIPQSEMNVVPAAGHFDFLAPCKPELIIAEPGLCGSAPGFDRAAFHRDFNSAVVRFFREALGA